MNKLFVVLAICALSALASASNQNEVAHVQFTSKAAAQEAMQRGIDDVIKLLKGMIVEFGKAEKADKANWYKYSAWSARQEKDKNAYIGVQTALLMSTRGTLNAKRNEVVFLTNAIRQLNKDVADASRSLRQMTRLRRREAQQHRNNLRDMDKTLRAMRRAIAILKGQYSKKSLVEVRAELLQAVAVYGTGVTEAGVRELTDFLQSDSEPAQEDQEQDQDMEGESELQTDGPNFKKVNGNKYKSYKKQGGAHGVIGTLKSLKKNLEANRVAAINKENEARKAYEQAKKSKLSDMARARADISAKSKQRKEARATIVSCHATIRECRTSMASARKYIRELLADRAKFTAQFKDRTVKRAQETVASHAALGALRSVSSRAKKTVSFLQTLAVTRQVTADPEDEDEPAEPAAVADTAAQQEADQTPEEKDADEESKEEEQDSEQEEADSDADDEESGSLDNVEADLQSAGEKLQSTALLEAAQMVQIAVKQSTSTEASTGKRRYDPSGFSPIRKLLKDLIARLEAEQQKESSHNSWCRKEKTSSISAKSTREKNLQTLMAEIEALTTAVAQLKSEIRFLDKSLRKVARETAAAISVRAKSQKAYERELKDHNEVIAAIAKALQALSSAYSFLQEEGDMSFAQTQAKTSLLSQQDGPSPFKTYKKGGGKSAMSMLQDLQNKYAQARIKLIADEKSARRAHAKLLAKNERFRLDTEATRLAKIKLRRSNIVRLSTAKEELRVNMLELRQVAQYLVDLRPACDDIRMSFEERRKRRTAELRALKAALKVLQNTKSR